MRRAGEVCYCHSIQRYPLLPRGTLSDSFAIFHLLSIYNPSQIYNVCHVSNTGSGHENSLPGVSSGGSLGPHHRHLHRLHNPKAVHASLVQMADMDQPVIVRLRGSDGQRISWKEFSMRKVGGYVNYRRCLLTLSVAWFLLIQT